MLSLLDSELVDQIWSFRFCLYVLLLVLLAIFKIQSPRWRLRRRFKKLPPGPWSWPLIGYLPSPNPKTVGHLKELSRKYGSVFGLFVGNQYVVVVDDFKVVREAFNKEEFLGRPPGSMQISPEQPSLIDMNGDIWKEHRRFKMNSFRTLGVGTKPFEKIVMGEVNDVVSKIRASLGGEVNIHHCLEHALNNVTFHLLYGKRFEPNHPLIRLLTDYDMAVLHLLTAQSFTCFHGWMKPFFELSSKIRRARRVIRDMDAILESEIEEHRRTLSPEEPRDYIDHFLIHMFSGKADPSYNMSTLKGNVKFFLISSSETTRLTLSWLFLCMARYPHIQEEVHAEVRSVLGSENEPRFDQRALFPLMEATLFESMRWRNLVNLNVLRKTTATTKLQGYDIPEGTVIMHNLTSHFRNPELWDRPDEFDPTRFLSKDRKRTEVPEHFIPFSYGRRMCSGEKLALIQLFLFAIILFQKFKFLPPKDGIRLDGMSIFNNHPVYPYVKVELRD